MWLLRQSPSIRWYLPEWQAAIDLMNWWYSTLLIALSTVLIGTFLHSYNYSRWKIKWIFWHFDSFTRIYWIRNHCFKSLDCQQRTLHENRYSLIVPIAHLLFTSNGFDSIFVSHQNENIFFSLFSFVVSVNPDTNEEEKKTIGSEMLMMPNNYWFDKVHLTSFQNAL